MAEGAFITLEGVEGVGKSTCLGIIRETIESRGHTTVLTREPGGTPLGERIREWILDGDHGVLSAQVEALLMFAARAEHIEKVIRPALEAGYWVVCDRFTDATVAYQGGGRGADAAFLRCLAEEVQGTLEPDLTLLLDAPVAVGRARISARKHDHFERETADFFERVRAAYLRLAAEAPGRIRVIDATAALGEVEGLVAAEIERFIGARHEH